MLTYKEKFKNRKKMEPGPDQEEIMCNNCFGSIIMQYFASPKPELIKQTAVVI